MLSFLLLLSDLNDDDKLLDIYHHYYPEMLKVASFIFCGKNPAMDAEDAVQNAFVNLQKSMHRISFWDDERRLHAYVIAVVKTESYKLLKNAVYCEDIGEYVNALVSDDDFVEQINRVELYQKVVDAISRLDDRYAIPMYMHWVDELSVKEIATWLGIPVKTVYTQLSRGKYLLLEMLKKEGVTYDP